MPDLLKEVSVADTYLVQLDLEQLRIHRSLLEQRELTTADIQVWLTQYGFYPRIDGLYLAEGPVLRQLEPDQILDAQPVESSAT